MDDRNAGESSGSEPPKGNRPPTDDDLAILCRRLNERGARYIIVGGMAITHAGYLRLTGNIDLLVDPDPENEAKVFDALAHLEDKTVLKLDPGDVAKYLVVRVSDEILVDLMAAASGITYDDAKEDIIVRTINGVDIPFATPQLLFRMKEKTHRAKDESDLVFLKQLIPELEGINPISGANSPEPGFLKALYQRLFSK